MDSRADEIAGKQVIPPTVYELSPSPTPADDAVNKFMAEYGFLNQVAANEPVAKVASAPLAEVAKPKVADKARVDEAWPMRGRGADNGSDDEEEANDLASDPTPPRPAPLRPDDDDDVADEEEIVVLHKETAASKLGLGLCVFSGDVAHPRIQHVKLGSLASASGRLQAMDIITAVNGTPIATDKQALDIISSALGDVRFAVRRDGCPAEQFLVRKPSAFAKKTRSAASSPQLDSTPGAPLPNAAPAAAPAEAIADNEAVATSPPTSPGSPKAPGPFRPVRAVSSVADSVGADKLEKARRASTERQKIMQAPPSPPPPPNPPQPPFHPHWHTGTLVASVPMYQRTNVPTYR
jgi:hypothetical protein